MLWVAVSILLIFSLITWCFLTLVLLKQYRFATLLTDLLPFYILFDVFSFFSYLAGLIIIVYINFSSSEEGSFNVGWFSFELIMILAGLILALYYAVSFYKWQANYSRKLYGLFLDELKKPKYSVKLFNEYRSYSNRGIQKDKINVYIRHDVDLSIPRLLRLIHMEKEREVFSTLFFRLHSEKYSFEKTIPEIKQLVDDGFEVGYHYEVLSQTKGNTEEAIKLFEKELNALRKIVPVKVVAHHGDKYSNHKIWSLIDKEALDVWSAYDMKRDIYITDTGGKFMTKDNNTHIFDQLKEAKLGDIVQILIHADWWY